MHPPQGLQQYCVEVPPHFIMEVYLHPIRPESYISQPLGKKAVVLPTVFSLWSSKAQSINTGSQRELPKLSPVLNQRTPAA